MATGAVTCPLARLMLEEWLTVVEVPWSSSLLLLSLSIPYSV